MNKSFDLLIKPYTRNQIYTGVYKIPKTGEIRLPGTHWKVRGYAGDCLFGLGVLDSSKSVVLILDDEKNSFWPVMSFLRRWEAAKLGINLLLRSILCF